MIRIVLVGPSDQLRPMADSELKENAFDVSFDSSGRDIQTRPDFSIGQAGSHEADDLFLAGGQ
jgi:hypothetical protein